MIKVEKIFQFKITLNGSKPPIWRRLLVEDTITFYKLHLLIQKYMGWKNCHLFEFDMGGLSIGIPHVDYVDDLN